MRRCLKIAAILAGAHFILCSAILIWYFRIQHYVSGDPFALHVLNHALLLVDSSRAYYGRRAVMVIALNSAIWGLAAGSLLYAFTAAFRKRIA